VSAGFGERAAKLSKNDWYRLGRALEIGRAAGEAGAEGAFTGARQHKGPQGGFDFRCFFIVGERAKICEKIDKRCEQMLDMGLLQEVAGLLRTGVLVPRTTAGKSIGYRQVAQYLLVSTRAQCAADLSSVLILTGSSDVVV
jgi:tRNA dimethylallyltransferase